MYSGQVSQPNPQGQSDSVFGKTVLHVVGLCVLTALLAACTNNSGSPAPVRNLNDPGSSSASNATGGSSYTVKPGDTLRKIAVATGSDESTIIKLNGISNPNSIRVGQVLRLSDKSDTSVGAAPIPLSNKPLGRPLDAPASADPATPKPADVPVTRAPDAAVANLTWPVNGTVIQQYTATTKGIDIAGNVGDPVVAAAGGKVVYAGNGVRGLGNLVILEHSNGFLTAYAHNKSLLVKTDQTVKQGSKIAELGQSEATSPRLHFEVRRERVPVDPLLYLPAKPM